MRETFREIPEFLASVHYALSGPVTLDEEQTWEDLDGDVIENFAQKGTVLGRITASGLYGPYDAGVADGRETAVGILWEDVSFTSPNHASVMMVHGWVRASQLIGLDVAAQTSLQLIGVHFPPTLVVPPTIWSILRGTVLDALGNPVEGATVTIQLEDGTTQTTTTDENGEFVFENVPPGDYTIEVSHPYEGDAEMEVTVDEDDTEEVEIEIGAEDYA